MNITYCPIFESGSVHDMAVRSKRGLYTALAKAGHRVTEYDYQARSRTNWFPDLERFAEINGCDLVISQFHGSDDNLVADIRAFRANHPNALWINWSGDAWSHSLTAPPILDMARAIDLQLVAAPDALEVYRREGIPAEFWNIAYEPPVTPLPEVPTYDVVWLANVINEKRKTLMERLKSLDGISVGIYGDWQRADGNNVYDFAAGEALYLKATIAIADNVYVDTQHYISNRPMQAMGAGRPLVLHQHVPRMEDISLGWRDGEHYIEWQDWDDLEAKINHWLKPEQAEAREQIVDAGWLHVMGHHTFEVRVRQLFDEFIPQIERVRT